MAHRSVRPTRDRDVQNAVEVIQRSGPYACEHVLRAMYQAVYAYADTRDAEILVQFARNALGTIALRELYEYEKAVEMAPGAPRGPGRSAADVRTEVRSLLA